MRIPLSATHEAPAAVQRIDERESRSELIELALRPNLGRIRTLNRGEQFLPRRIRGVGLARQIGPAEPRDGPRVG